MKKRKHAWRVKKKVHQATRNDNHKTPPLTANKIKLHEMIREIFEPYVDAMVKQMDRNEKILRKFLEAQQKIID